MQQLALVLLIPLNLVVLNIWLWLFDNIFYFEKKKNKIFWTTILIGLIAGLGIVFYPNILAFFNLTNFNFVAKTNLTSIKTIFYFRIYLSLLIFITKAIFKNFSFSKFFIINYSIFSILFLGVGFFTQNYLAHKVILIYYIFIAFGEEFIKYLLAVNIFENNNITKNDLILFCILSSLGFAFIENLVYIYQGFQGNQSLLNLLGGGITLLIARGLIGFLVHIIFTGNIGFLVSKKIKKILPLSIFIGIILGTGLHYFYDVLLEHNHKIVILGVFIIGYIWITYLFYNSDRFYLQS